MRSIYLDYSSSTPIAGSVREAMLPYFSEHYGDPSNDHWMGRVATEAIEDARSAVSSLLSCHPTEIYFTSGGTESINLGLIGFASEWNPDSDHVQPPHVIISAIEHLAVSRCAEELQRRGWRVTRIGCDRDGAIKLDHLEGSIRDETRLISVMHVNHEIGSIQPIEKIAEMCSGRNIVLHTDACQSIGKIHCDVERLNIDMLSLSGHKFYAPKGIGALYVRSGIPIRSIGFGEFQERGIRPGMENVAGIVGLGQAARLAVRGIQDSNDRLAILQDRFIHRLEALLPNRFDIHGRRTSKVPGLISLMIRGKSATDVLKKCPELCVGPTGHEGRVDSYLGMATTLAAMGVTPQEADSTFRLSFGWNTTEEDVDRAADLLTYAVESSTDRC